MAFFLLFFFFSFLVLSPLRAWAESAVQFHPRDDGEEREKLRVPLKFVFCFLVGLCIFFFLLSEVRYFERIYLYNRPEKEKKMLKKNLGSKLMRD
jgi:hypothetical protein